MDDIKTFVRKKNQFRLILTCCYNSYELFREILGDVLQFHHCQEEYPTN